MHSRRGVGHTASMLSPDQIAHYRRHGYVNHAAESVLLLDEALIEEQQGIHHEVQIGVKSPALMVPDRDKPWEYCGAGMSKRIHLYGTVLYDDLMGKYRMWYMGRMGPHWRFSEGNYQIPGLYIPRTDALPHHCNGVTHDHHGRALQTNDRGDLTLYAESDDGLEWVKPQLGIFTFNGDANNNIVWDLHGAAVFIDREADPEKRYQAIGFCRRYRGIFLLTSPDGIHWDDRHHLEPVVDRTNEGAFNVTWDSRDRLFRAYSIERSPDREERRIICYTESPTLEGPWKASRPLLEPTSWDDAVAERKYGALRAEFYDLSAFRYHNVHLGLVGALYVTAEKLPDEKNQIPCDGPIDAQLVYSRDGLSWTHADRERTPVIPRGTGDGFDRGMIIGTAKEPVIEGDAIHWYYTGCEHGHGETDFEKRVKCLARATWQRDRFIALHAPEEGMVTTKAAPRPPGGALTVNADAAGGQVQVELCAADGTVVEGFSRHQCRPLRGDQLDEKVTWRSADISDLPKAVKIRFILQRSKLYSYRWN